MQRKVLGRGLDALIATSTPTAQAEPPASAPAAAPGPIEVAIADVEPNPHQPRLQFDDDAIRELAASIKTNGVLQPILVRVGKNGGYQLVAGERRLRASGFAGLEKIPAIIRDVSDNEMIEMALVENIQRENLNPIEEAKAFQALSEKAGLTHDQISERVGKQRTSVSNSLRLLGLPPEVRDMVSRGTLSAGHGRALLGLENPVEIASAARYVSSKGFSVRRTEAFVQRRLRRVSTRTQKTKSVVLQEWEIKLQQRFGTRVSITGSSKRGKVEFEFYSQEDLERLLEAWGVL